MQEYRVIFDMDNEQIAFFDDSKVDLPIIAADGEGY